MRRLPEHPEWSCAALMVPDTRGDDTVATRHPSHLDEPGHGVGHEVNDKLGHGRIERRIIERKLLGGSTLHVDGRMTLLHGGGEGLRRIDSRHGPRAQPPHQLGRQRARAATDVEHALSRLDRGQVGERGSEGNRVPPHEAVIRIGTNGEAHARNLGAVERADVPDYDVADGRVAVLRSVRPRTAWTLRRSE